MKTKLGLVLFFGASLAASMTFAKNGGGSDAGNGGNEIALEFFNAGKRALQIYNKVLSTYPELKGKDLVQALEKTQILVSSTTLYVDKDGVRQESTAMNFENPSTIVVHDKKWKRISQLAIKEALALHEVLGLVGIEKTGDYHISKGYLQFVNVPCKNDICDGSEAKESGTYCRFLNNWYPVEEYYRFTCNDKGREFLIWCDMSLDPIEFGTNKIDALGGVLEKKSDGRTVLNFSGVGLRGGMYCKYDLKGRSK